MPRGGVTTWMLTSQWCWCLVKLASACFARSGQVWWGARGRWTTRSLAYLGLSLTLPSIAQTREQQLAEIHSMLWIQWDSVLDGCTLSLHSGSTRFYVYLSSSTDLSYGPSLRWSYTLSRMGPQEDLENNPGITHQMPLSLSNYSTWCPGHTDPRTTKTAQLYSLCCKSGPRCLTQENPMC